MARIGFVGLGNMGSGMAANLAKAGHDVRAFDLDNEALARAKKNGCRAAGSAAETAAQADAVVTMLPAGEHVRDVYENHVIGAAPTDAILIDCSTIDVATAREENARAEAQGYRMVDAPVSGGIAAAQEGSLTFMVGGTSEAFEQARPFLADMGKAVIHAGRSGAGQAAKICNNMLLGASMIATCETFLLARRLGLDLQTFFDIASQASGQCWSMTSYCPVPGVGPVSPADGDYEGGFSAALMLKDLRLAMEAARSVDSYTPMGSHAEKLYARFAELGGAGRDFSAIIRMIESNEASTRSQK